jgi:hypothetical protein
LSWTRLDDGWIDQQILADLPLATRWHYLGMIQFCSRTQRFDGFIRAVDAARCSDVDHPDAALRQLADVGLIVSDQGGYVVVNMEEAHAPPPWVRNRTESNKQAQRRKRAHDAGEHSLCLPANCELAPNPEAELAPKPEADGGADSHADKTADSRTGQAQDKVLENFPKIETSDSWPGDPDSWTPEKDAEWLRG